MTEQDRPRAASKAPPKAARKPRRDAAQAAPPKSPEAGERIAKVLSRAGVASRREAERMIELGEVKVNGQVITSPALNVTPKDRILVNGQPLAAKEPARLWLYYKPLGLVTSASDEKGRDTVFDHLPEDLPRVMSIGRLDLNSEGLLLLTNDGELKRRLELPSTGWLRKYRVRINGRPEDGQFEPLRQGITVEGEQFQPMQVTLDRQQGANAWLTIGLREGRNREIRRALAFIGFTVNRLIRISYGPFRLNELAEGAVEEIRPRILRDQLGFDPDDGTEVTPAPEPRRAGAKSGTARAGGTAAGSKAAEAKPARAPRSTSDATPTRRPATAPRGEDGPARRSTGPGPAAAKAPRRPAAGDAPSTTRRRADPDAPRSVEAPRSRSGFASAPDGKPTRRGPAAEDRAARPARSTEKPAPHSGPRSRAGKPAADEGSGGAPRKPGPARRPGSGPDRGPDRGPAKPPRRG